MTNDQTTTDLSTKSEKCSKSRLVTTSAIKHFTPKVAYFYPKSGVVLGARTYNVVETRRQGVQGVQGVQKRINISRTSHLVPRTHDFINH